MPVAPFQTWQLAGLQPMYPWRARAHHVRLPANVSYLKGQVLAEVIGTSEAQTITLTTGGTLGGTYTLSYGGLTTGNIAFNATAATVQAALEALATIGTGNVLVTGTTPTTSGGVLTATYRNALGYRDVAALTGSASGLTGTTPGLTIATATAGSGRANEVQTISASGTVSGGTFTVTYSGQTTSALAYNVSTADLQAALEALSNIQPGDIVATGTAGSIYILTAGGSFAATNIAAVTIDNTAITGGGSYVVATTVGGAAGTPGTFRAFDATATNGAQIARALLAYDTTTDASGNHSFAQSGVVAEFSATWQGVPAYFDGDFQCGDLTGFTEAALASNPAWKLINGTTANGVVSL